jgi:hypothetical protein
MIFMGIFMGILMGILMGRSEWNGSGFVPVLIAKRPVEKNALRKSARAPIDMNPAGCEGTGLLPNSRTPVHSDLDACPGAEVRALRAVATPIAWSSNTLVSVSRQGVRKNNS